MKIARLLTYVSVTLSLAFLLAGCANMPYSIEGDGIPPTSRITGWKEKPVSLTVVFSSPFVSETLGENGLEYAPYISEWLAARLQMELKSVSGIVPKVKIVDEEYFDVVKQKVVDDESKIPYIRVDSNDSLHGLVLSISQIIFFRNIDPCAKENVCITNKFPVIKGTYSFMDADTRKVYGFGEFFVEDEISSEKETGDWETAVKAMLTQILWLTPLAK